MPFFRENKFVNIKGLITTFFATVITVGAGIYVSQLIGPFPLSIQQTLSEKQNTFDVTGKSEINTVPDQAELSVGIGITRPTVVDGQQAVNQVINSITSQLVQLGINEQDIQTQNYSIYPQYDYESTPQKIAGYQVNSQLHITVRDFTVLNQAIDTAANLGANQIGGITFSLSQDLQDTLTKQARQEAISKAKDDAEELARLADIKLGRIVNVIEAHPSNNQSQPMYRVATADGSPQEPTQIQPGSSSFVYQVTLSYETL